MLLFDVDSVATGIFLFLSVPCIYLLTKFFQLGPLSDNLADGKQSGHEYHRTLLAALHTPGLDEHIDPVFAEYAGVLAMKRSARISSYE